MEEPEETVSVDQGEAGLAVAETGFWPNGEAPQAYSGDTIVDYPDTGAQPYQNDTDEHLPAVASRRNSWALSVAALLLSVAALVMAGAHGARVLTSPPAAPAPAATSTVPAPGPLAAMVPSGTDADKDRLFLANVHELAPGLFVGPPSPESDAQAVRVGRNMAERIVAGGGPVPALNGLIANAQRGRANGDQGVPSDRDIAVLTYAAMLAYCPQYLPQAGK